MSKLPTHLPRLPSLLSHRPSSARTTTPFLSSGAGPSTSPAPYNSTSPTAAAPFLHQQSRSAVFVPRPRRPYSFTQLIQLSDGSAFTVRSTSPVAMVRSVKDSRNHALWQPSDKSLKNVEVDEAGKLAAFRERFGRGFDIAASSPSPDAAAAAAVADAKSKAKAKADADASPKVSPSATEDKEDVYDLGDLISGYATPDTLPPKNKQPPPWKPKK